MDTPEQRLQKAMQYAMVNRPTVGGFPFLAECLRLAGFEANLWALPSAQSVYVAKDGAVVQQGTPLVSGVHIVPMFNEQALITALRADQAGNTTFPEFLIAAWNAGVVRYEVLFTTRTVIYYGVRGEAYTETYPEVTIIGLTF